MTCLICGNEILIQNFQAILSLRKPIICSTCKSQIRYKREYVRKGSGTVVTLFEGNAFIEAVLKRIEMGDMVLLDVFYPYIRREVNRWIKDYGFVSPVDEGKGYDAATVLIGCLNVHPCKTKKVMKLSLIGDRRVNENLVIICIISDSVCE